MQASHLIAILSIIITLLTTVAIYILNGIKRAQDSTNREIKEMNIDIRNMLVQLGKSDEKVDNMANRVDRLETFINKVEDRVIQLETSK